MNDVEFEDNSIKVKEALNDAVKAWLYEAGGELEARVKRNTSVDSSQLKNSWRYKVSEHKRETYVGSPLENAIWEEFGTGEYALKGNGRKTPWYVPVDGYTGTKKPTYNGKVVIVYGKNGKKFYKTNGKSPKRAFYNAFNSSKDKIIASLKRKLKGLDK